jgi:hypothetical protein
MRNAHKILGGKFEEEGPPHRHGCDDNINMCLKELRREGVDWINLAQERDQWRALLNTVMKLCVS